MSDAGRNAHHTVDAFKSSNASADSVFKYCASVSCRLPDSVNKLFQATRKHPGHFMATAPETLQLNYNTMRLIQAKRVLDVGTFTGLSALTAAHAIPQDGRVVTMDVTADPRKGEIQGILDGSGVGKKIEYRLDGGIPALDALIAAGEAGTFDFAYIDAVKTEYIEYYERCMTLLRPGGVVSIDNCLWSGEVCNPNPTDKDTKALRALNQHVFEDSRCDNALLHCGDGTMMVYKHW